MRITSMPDIPAATPGVQTTINQKAIHEPSTPVAPTVTEAALKSSEQLSPEYAKFAKMEKSFRSKVQAREEELKKREEALKAKESEYGANYIQKSKISELFQTDSQRALKELGLSGDTLTNALLNQPSPQDQMIQELKSEIAALKGVPDQTKKMFEDRDKQAYDSAVHQIRTDVKSLVSDDPAFEVIKRSGLEEEVVSRIIKNYEENQTLLNPEQAAKIVEDETFESIIQCFEIPKVKQKIQEMLSSQVESPVSQAPKAPIAKTLTHSQVSPSLRTMSARERAILAFEGKLT